MLFYAITGLINAIASTILGFFVFLKNAKARVNQTFALFCLSVAAWSYAYYFWQMSDTAIKALFWSRGLMFGAIFIFIFYFHFVISFLGKNHNNKIFLILGYIAALVFTVLNFTPLFVRNVEQKLGFKFWPNPGIAYHPFLLIWFAYVIYCTYLLFTEYRQASGIKRNQIRYIMIGITTGFIGGATNYLLWYNVPVPPIGNMLVVVYVGATAYAITRYRLMDIRIAVRSTLVYVFSFLTVVGLSFGSHFLINHFFVVPILWEVLIVAIVAAGLFHPFTELYLGIANRYLFGQLYNQHEAIKKFSQQLTSIIDLDKLVSSVAEIIQKTLGIDKFALFLVSETDGCKLHKNIGFKQKEIVLLICNSILINRLKQREMRPLTMEELKMKTEASIILPLVVKNDLRGLIVLGEKTSDGVFSKEDMELLETLSNQASVALENARLYDQVQDLTENLQEKVDEQTKDIRQLSEMKTEFLRIVNHQLRTPVSIIKSMLSMLVEGSYKGKKKEEAISKVYISSERLETILDDLLNAQNLVGKELTLNLEPTKIQEIIEKVVKEFKTAVEQKGLNLTLNEPKGEIPVLLLDQNLIETVFKKILDNAVVYTEKGEVSISIQKTNGDVQVIVADTGTGISKEDLPRLFKLFQRGKNAERIHQNGSGLGLFISKEYVEAHHGTIQIQSEEGRGTRVIIDLPTGKI